MRLTDPRNLVLTGFMGCGKSAIGREVARRMGRAFVDTDQLIETRTGRSIPDIFARDGEAAFRALEAEICRELGVAQDLVIATGGWTLGTPENRAAIAVNSLVICLRADAVTLIERLGSAEGRPMLADQDWQARLRGLLARRLPVYLSFPLQVNTANLSVGQAADRVLALWETFGPDGAEQLPASLPVTYGEDGYSVLIGDGLLEQAGVLLAAAGRWSGIAVISDQVVEPLYVPQLTAALQRAAQPPCSAAAMGHPISATMPAGEAYKTLETVTQLYATLLAGGLDRGGLILALGGGVVGDVAGFTAATYMRGVALAQLPTTLLAMVDSSVGGKTGVDLPYGKNLVGAFKQPVTVLIDPLVLKTLPDAELRAGMAEVVKAGVIGDPELFARLERGAIADMAWLIHRAVAVKIAVVEADPYERGYRAVLNLGHTFGHAFELLSEYRMRHGEAVAIGMAVAAQLAARLGLCQIETAQRIIGTLQRLGLPTAVPAYPAETIWEAMTHDKKKRDGRLRFVLPHAIGHVAIHDDVPREQVLEVLEMLKEGDRVS
ncbi:MAG: 3-dehydroquinate synthase [Anaerolineae bacterium]|nr:3-dehydroquinate synthase [Anaerolineae bacterium]MDW8070716.1 3-dehydroquinate synthase [Anaerolineae bacterium]